MPSFETVRVAAVQATPATLDADATADKVVRLLAEAAGEGARLAVLPETFVPLYPSNVWGGAAAAFSGFDELWKQSVNEPGPFTEPLAAAGAELVVVGPDGLLAPPPQADADDAGAAVPRHRAGQRLAPVDTPAGRIGGLIC